MRFVLTGVAALAATTAVGQDPADSLQEFRREVCAVLAKLDPTPKDRAAAREALRRDLWKVVDKHAKLRPDKGSKTYVSTDKAFVLVIAANGGPGLDGEGARADHKSALLVVAVGGVGGPAQGGKDAGGGGMADARAESGVAVALGGRGGVGGGGGAGAGGQGGIGLIGLGGEGGKSADGSEGGEGGHLSTGNLKAIAEAARKAAGK
jgi:hypothetical protein